MAPRINASSWNIRLVVSTFVLAAHITLSGCVRKAPAAPVAQPDPPARITRPQTPGELFGGPRPKLPEEVVTVLDALWARQLQIHRLEIRMQIEELDEAGNPRADKRPLTRYVAWDERYGYRVFSGGEGFICDGTQHIDLALDRKTPCPEMGFHANTAPLFEAEPLGASRLESLVRAPGAKVTGSLLILDGVKPAADRSGGMIRVSTKRAVIFVTNGGSDGRTELTIWFDPAIGDTPIRAEQKDYLYAISRTRPVSVQTTTGEQFTEKAPGLWMPGLIRTENTQYDPISRKDITTRFRETLVDFIVNGPSNPALFLPGVQPPQPPTP